MKWDARAREVLAILAANREPWTGPVERRSPKAYQRSSIIEFWRCCNPYCRAYTPRGSVAAGRCLLCYTPKPAGKP